MASSETFPITISSWRAAQLAGNGLPRLLSLAASERAANTTTRAWIWLATDELLTAQWNALAGKDPGDLPLYGVPFAAKDNIDAIGFSTTAACPAFAGEPATTDAPVIANLKAAGAIVLGKTNLDQFATGLNGTRSPYGAVPNAFSSLHISGGSSSGSAVVVSRGVVPFSLGTDTAGSGRVPAGLNNIYGLKPTRGAISARKVVPACRTLDCVSIFALEVDDAEAVLSVAEKYDPEDSYSRPRPSPSVPSALRFFREDTSTTPDAPKLAICADPPWFGDAQHATAYDVALEKARALGWELVPIDFTMLFGLAAFLYEGAWVAERYAAIRGFLEDSLDDRAVDMDPTVRGIVLKARGFSAADAFAQEYERQDLARRIQGLVGAFDGLLVPTSPTFPSLEDLRREPVAANSRLGTYTNFVNFLDWSALSVPAGFREDGLPFGITLISGTWEEPKLAGWARRWRTAVGELPLGATGRTLGEGVTSKDTPEPSKPDDNVLVAVVGAHLTGFPLNEDLTSRGATLHQRTTTSPSYKLYALASSPNTPVKKPGLRRVLVSEADCGRPIELEVWNLPSVTLASFMATIPPPLAIGSVELADGSWVRGFLCEPWGFADAADVTEFGGWRAYIASLNAQSKPTPPRKITSVLIANRGEIAVRIIHTLRKLQIRAVAIYSVDDASAPHVRDADVALPLTGGTVAETYLNGAQIIQLAKQEAVDAIIPGYGFLSESAEFAAQVEAAGLVWVGPAPDHMEQLGLKHTARVIAAAAGVPTLPGSEILPSPSSAGATETTTADSPTAVIAAEAERIGFPIILKSTAGGGGIGLRRCDSAAELAKALEGAQRLAAANFGHDGVFLERFVANARHVEVQILGDGQGRVVAAGERDCSLQRRHQKVVEESPALLVPIDVRQRIRETAIRLASAVKYRNIGTVEFLLDVDTYEFYFLEVNTRLQVEHPVTEKVTRLDLVECMLKIAGQEADFLFTDKNLGSEDVSLSGAAIEVRLYAENPLQSFRPTAGRIEELSLPSSDDGSVRVDTWVEQGTQVTTRYDPMLAKIIAYGPDRPAAVERLAAALAATQIAGVQTNLDYLRAIVASEMFHTGAYTTRTIDSFRFTPSSLEVVEPGGMTTIQDFPGRLGRWHEGVPPSGPMDDVSFRLANRLVGNEASAAAIECTLKGPSLKFHRDAVIAIAGGKVPAKLDGEDIPTHQAINVQAGQTLSIGLVEVGYRAYVAVRGGIHVPLVLGSRSTFALGKLGGLNGRKLERGDVVPLGSNEDTQVDGQALASTSTSGVPIPPSGKWTVRVVPGPHGAPDFFTTQGIQELLSPDTIWKVHYNSNRLGVRLSGGPRPQWARESGGEAGLHPSNIHDSVYSVGSVSFTGDEAVVLTCDGPSLGGFVVFCVVAAADLWKLGQVRPGDEIRLQVISEEQARAAEKKLDAWLERSGKGELSDGDKQISSSPEVTSLVAEHSTAFSLVENSTRRILARQAGDIAMLLTFGDVSDPNGTSSPSFSLRQSFEVLAFVQQHSTHPIPGVTELSPGVGTLHVQYAHGIPATEMRARLAAHAASYQIPTRVKSRTLHLPLAFEDERTKAAIRRYQRTIRAEAPWVPSNAEFLAQLNGLEDGLRGVERTMAEATFLVLGLGDVFMGSPCAVPLDPRHRLFGTKYNPTRTSTPIGSVGIGGQYMCVYAADDGPGGYQIVGRTVPDLWEYSSANQQGPRLRLFDRIRFYLTSEQELNGSSWDRLVKIEDDDELDLDAYEAWLAEHAKDIAEHQARRKEAIAQAPFLAELLRPYDGADRTGKADLAGKDDEVEDDEGGVRVKANIPGRCWKVEVGEGEAVRKGAPLVYLESSKMEIEITSPVEGVVARVVVKEGDLVDAVDDLVVVEARSG